MFICIGTVLTTAHAQLQLLGTLDREQYLAKVKLVDEFFARFNGEEQRNDLPTGNADRSTNLLLLFDLSRFSSKQDSNFLAARQFVQKIIDSDTRLNFEDKNWFAKITCHGKLKGKKISFPMYLCVEERGDGMYKWVIANVEGEPFQTSRDNPHSELFIMPNDNEQFFSSIRKTTTEAYPFIDDYAKSTYKASALPTFMTLVRFNLLKIDYVDNVEFIFMQVPDYIFTIKHFERESKNAGWLISSYGHCGEKTKKKTLNNIRQ